MFFFDILMIISLLWGPSDGHHRTLTGTHWDFDGIYKYGGSKGHWDFDSIRRNPDGMKAILGVVKLEPLDIVTSDNAIKDYSPESSRKHMLRDIARSGIY